jgi:hypothetical protein
LKQVADQVGHPFDFLFDDFERLSPRIVECGLGEHRFDAHRLTVPSGLF